MASLLRRPQPSDECADPQQVRRFSLFKLFVLLLLLGTALVLIVRPGISAPSLTAPPADILTGELLLSGRGTPGSVVEVLAGERLLGSATVSDNGEWEWSAFFAPGRYALLAQGVAEGGTRLSAPEGQGKLNVVDRPTLEVTTAHAEEAVAEVTAFGQGTPGSNLRLVWNERPVADIEVGGDGRWQHLLPPVSVPSANTFLAQVLDRAGTVLGASAPRFLQLEGAVAAPAPLRVDRVAFDRLYRAAAEEVINGELTVQGAGQPGAQITVWREDIAVRPAVTVADDGSWQLAAPLGLAPGAYAFGVQMTSNEGQLLEEGTFDLAVPRPPTLEVSGGRTDLDTLFLTGTAQPDEAVRLYVNDSTAATLRADKEGEWQHQMHLAAGRHQLFVRSRSGLDSDPREVRVMLARPVILGQSQDAEGKPLPGFFGEARPNVRLEIIEAEEIIGEAIVDADGRWECRCTLRPGEHSVWVREVTEPARASEPLTVQVENPVPPFVPGQTAPGAPPFRCPDPSPPGVVEGGVYIIGCGESLGLIAARLGVTVEELLSYNPQLGQPPSVYFGQRLNVPAGAACKDASAET